MRIYRIKVCCPLLGAVSLQMCTIHYILKFQLPVFKYWNVLQKTIDAHTDFLGNRTCYIILEIQSKRKILTQKNKNTLLFKNYYEIHDRDKQSVKAGVGPSKSRPRGDPTGCMPWKLASVENSEEPTTGAQQPGRAKGWLPL